MPSAPDDLSRLRIDRSSAAPANRGLSFLIIFLLLGIIGYLAWERLGEARDSRPAVEIGRVLRVGGASAQSGIAANGYVIARRQAALSTDVQGRLIELAVEEGSRVVEGQRIARLDTRQLEASIARTRSELAEARAEAELRRLDLDRATALVADAVAPVADLDERRARREQALARIGALTAALAELQVLIDKSSVFAPFDGVITAKNAEIGEVVSAVGGGALNSRGAVATLVDFASLEVQVELAQTSLGSIALGQAALVYLDAFPEVGYPGRVRQIIPTANRQKATVELRVALDAIDDRVLPEMGARVVFTAGESSQPAPVEVQLPAAALSGNQVFVYHDGVVEARDVAVGDRRGAVWVVTDGLQGGEQVVLGPPPELTDGAAVQLRQAREELK